MCSICTNHIRKRGKALFPLCVCSTIEKFEWQQRRRQINERLERSCCCFSYYYFVSTFRIVKPNRSRAECVANEVNEWNERRGRFEKWSYVEHVIAIVSERTATLSKTIWMENHFSKRHKQPARAPEAFCFSIFFSAVAWSPRPEFFFLICI